VVLASASVDNPKPRKIIVIKKRITIFTKLDGLAGN
jgi:hypothetical protein